MMPTQPEPLARLLLRTANMLVDELHARLAEEGWGNARNAWGFALGHIRSAEPAFSELAAFLGVTKQAVTKTVDQLVEADLVHVRIDPHDRRVRHLSLTDGGQAFLTQVERIYLELEQDLATRTSTIDIAEVRRILGIWLEAETETFPRPMT